MIHTNAVASVARITSRGARFINLDTGHGTRLLSIGKSLKVLYHALKSILLCYDTCGLLKLRLRGE